MQGIVIGTGVIVATVAAFWRRRDRRGWRTNDWFAAAGMVTAITGLAAGLLR